MKKEVLSRIAEEIEAKKPSARIPIKIIAVDGHGGAGKSTIAGELAKELGAEIIHTDDFASWDNPRNWWPRVIEEILKPIESGARTLSYGRSQWAEDHNPEPVKNQLVTPIMILEGVSSARKEFRPYLTYAVWVEAPRELCLKRGLERDGEAMRKQWEEWLANEDAYIARDKPQEYADIRIDGSRIIQPE